MRGLRLHPGRLSKIFFWGLLALMLASVINAMAASMVMDGITPAVGHVVVIPIANDLKPPQCTMYISKIVSGSGTINGTSLNDLIYGSSGSDIIDGGGGNDCIFGLGGNDTIDGGADDDIIIGGDGTDTCIDAVGSNTIDCETSAAPTPVPSPTP